MKIFINLLFIFQFLLAEEVYPLEIPINGDAANKKLEMSGLAWYKDNLILLPQYIDRDNPKFYYLTKNEIQDWLKGDNKKPISPKEIDLIIPNFYKTIPGYQGFEAISFIGKNAFIIVESKQGGIMKSFIIKGKINFKDKILSINKRHIKEIPIPINIKNMGYESILKINNKLLVFFEANGENLISDSKALIFTRNLKSKPSISFPSLEYRLTDVTELNSEGNFWGLNFFWPGEKDRLKPAKDQILTNAEVGETHKKYQHVERLVEYKINKNSILRTQRPAIQLSLEEGSRNWEGLVRLGDQGFLMVVDEYPRTILAFIPAN